VRHRLVEAAANFRGVFGLGENEHELCHRRHMNHSKAFWAMVASIMPEYKTYRQWLKEHGRELNIEYHLVKTGIL